LEDAGLGRTRLNRAAPAGASSVSLVLAGDIAPHQSHFARRWGFLPLLALRGILHHLASQLLSPAAYEATSSPAD